MKTNVQPSLLAALLIGVGISAEAPACVNMTSIDVIREL